jgi:hypothetical protein
MFEKKNKGKGNSHLKDGGKICVKGFVAEFSGDIGGFCCAVRIGV